MTLGERPKLAHLGCPPHWPHPRHCPRRNPSLLFRVLPAGHPPPNHRGGGHKRQDGEERWRIARRRATARRSLWLQATPLSVPGSTFPGQLQPNFRPTPGGFGRTLSPNSAKFGPDSATYSRVRSNLAHVWQTFDQLWPSSAEIGPIPAKSGPGSSKIGRSRHTLGRTRSRFGRDGSNVGRTRREDGRIRRRSDATFGRVRARFGRNRTEFGRARPNVAKCLPALGQIRPKPRTCSRIRAGFCRTRTGLGRNRPDLAGGGRICAGGVVSNRQGSLKPQGRPQRVLEPSSPPIMSSWRSRAKFPERATLLHGSPRAMPPSGSAAIPLPTGMHEDGLDAFCRNRREDRPHLH